MESREVAVCCPFDHITSSGLAYKETTPSAHVNFQEGLIHCKVCGVGYNESAFMVKLLGTTYAKATKLQHAFNNQETRSMYINSTSLNATYKAMANEFGITDEVLEELSVSSLNQRGLEFPVFMYDKLVDIRTYNPDSTPKVKSRRGASSGLVIPYDIWRNTLNRITIVCAGEKDMAVARSQGFNAITITGGEKALPICMNDFKDRHIVIAYDNDPAGIDGAYKLALELEKTAASVKVLTNFHEVCHNNKEDLTDFFTKYGKTRQDFIDYIEATPLFELPEGYYDKKHPLVTLLEATRPDKVNKVVRSNIQVVATSEAAFTAPGTILAKKFKTEEDDGKNHMYLNEVREWNFEEDTAKDILHLVDNNFREQDLKKNMKDLTHVYQKERYVSVRTYAKQTVFKCYVTDMFETTDNEVVPMEYTAYSIGCKLESGKKYLATYKLVPHPYKGQQLTMIILSAEQANDSVSEFRITDQVKTSLQTVADIQGSVPEKIHELTERVKGLLGYDGNNLLIETLDLAYHTPLQFNLGKFKNERAYLDTMVVTESRVGKSSTIKALRSAYGLGIVTSLAGNSATVSGLIGGSSKVAGGGYQTRAGLIPQNHKGLMVFEEFGKCNANLTTELTDIRSSNEVRITRVSGTLTLPAMVRMIALTNVKSNGREIKPIASYPNGISIITELVGSAEDIARYDVSLILDEYGSGQVDPFWQPKEPLEPQVYKDRIRWVWSRQPEQIIIDETVGHYIINQSNELNKVYDSHIKIFGTEAWKKLTRLSIAIAGYLASTDDTYENIVVTTEHVDHAIAYFEKIYDNRTFKLKEYVAHERKYAMIDDAGVELLQRLYAQSPTILNQLEQGARTNRNMLLAISGADLNTFNNVFKRLVSGMFVRLNNTDIYPTERFRKGMARIDRNVQVREVGDISVTVGNTAHNQRSGY